MENVHDDMMTLLARDVSALEEGVDADLLSRYTEAAPILAREVLRLQEVVFVEFAEMRRHMEETEKWLKEEVYRTSRDACEKGFVAGQKEMRAKAAEVCASRARAALLRKDHHEGLDGLEYEVAYSQKTEAEACEAEILNLEIG